MVGGDWPVAVLAGGYGKAWDAYRSILAGYPADVQTKVLERDGDQVLRLGIACVIESRTGGRTSVTLSGSARSLATRTMSAKGLGCIDEILRSGCGKLNEFWIRAAQNDRQY